MNAKISVALIGAGAMGGAMLRGWLAKGVIDAARSAVFDPAPAEWLAPMARDAGITVNPIVAAPVFEAVVVAVKPQAAGEVLPRFNDLSSKAVVISVMAGRSIASIAASLPRAREIVRAMPNLPAAIGAGATGLYAPPGVAARQREIAETLMSAAGATIWVDSEMAIDAVTAISGSGPAYFFLLAEALEEAARSLGLERDAARVLARATLAGAGAYAARDGRALEALRRAVTSPGGTTEAALAVLDGEHHSLRKLVDEAVKAAAARAAALTR